MDSTYGRDPSEYWVKVEYDTGREELYENLSLNQAYELKAKYESNKQAQHKPWKHDVLKEHISDVNAGRKS